MAAIIKFGPREWGESTEGNGWERCYATFEIAAFRDGWGGAWDAIKAAWKKDKRIQVPQEISFSLYIKADLNEFDRIEEEYVWGAQMETGGQNNGST